MVWEYENVLELRLSIAAFSKVISNNAGMQFIQGMHACNILKHRNVKEQNELNMKTINLLLLAPVVYSYVKWDAGLWYVLGWQKLYHHLQGRDESCKLYSWDYCQHCCSSLFRIWMRFVTILLIYSETGIKYPASNRAAKNRHSLAIHHKTQISACGLGK